MRELTFEDLERQEVLVPFRGKKYVLTEATGDAAIRFRNARMSAGRLTPDGKSVILVNPADVEPLLVSRCLYHADANDSLRLTRDGDPDPNFLVAEARIRTWPPALLTKLYDEVIR